MSFMGYKRLEHNHSLIWLWHIYEMDMWDEDYFNMETQAYIKITPTYGGEFQLGLVTGSIDGYLEDNNGKERFAFTWDGSEQESQVHP